MPTLNPEKNKKVRAALYVIGCGGMIHLVALLFIAITRRDAHYFNPLYTIDVDQIWTAASNNWLVYGAGWLVFFSLIYSVYRWLLRK
jgi:hypothetical protein